jgi:ferredoxin-NADP reductase
MGQPVRLRARIERAIAHDEDLRTFVIGTERRIPRFRPGQFLHLAIDPHDPSTHWPESRVFSIASPPQERTTVTITVSRVGEFTGRMMSLKEGDEVWIKLPYGEFMVGGEPGDTVVLVAGGTGVSPFVSYLAGMPQEGIAVRLLYGVRRPNLLIWERVLNDACKRWEDFSWTPFVEQGELPGSVPGRLTVAAALRQAGQATGLDRSTFYLAGPPAMIRVFESGLTEHGIDAARIRVDAWS